MKKAVFLDRDGIINSDNGLYYISDPDEFRLNPGIAELLKWLSDKGFLLIIISNQGGIAKGIYGPADTERVHRKMIELLAPSGVRFAEIYYCPHHPDVSRCLCRKPGTVMIEKGLARFDIDPSLSLFIGDRETDMEAGRNAGLKTLLAEPNQDMMLLTERISELLQLS